MNTEIVIGNSGKWTVESPYSVDDIEYECTAINTFSSLESLGISVLTKVYQDVGLGTSEYDLAKSADIRLITLTSSNGMELLLPEDKITSVPRYETVPYSHVVIGVDIGLLWDQVDLDSISAEVNSLVSNHTGIATTTLVRRIPVSEVIPKDKHNAIELARATNQVFDTTANAKLATANERIAEMTTRMTFLETIIKENL